MGSHIEIYQNTEGIWIEVQFDQETIWLSQLQMADLFSKDVRTINEHVKTVYKTGELEQDQTIRKFRIVRREGKRQVKRTIDYYNLDMIISVGYRVNSKRGTQFRQWATQRLKDYLIQGYAINEKRLAERQMQVDVLKTGIRILSKMVEKQATEEDGETLRLFAKGLDLLDDYDHGQLDSKGNTVKEARFPTLKEYLDLIRKMKSNFLSDIFAKPKDDGFESSLAQIAQCFDGKELYLSIEEKAAMLLYLIVKNHSFVDGNKRIGAACFLYFLQRNDMLMSKEGDSVISNDGLAALTLFVANSKPEEKESIVKFIISVLNYPTSQI